MADEMTTPTSDIVQSFRAIKVAATERHAAIVQELQELEAAFPELASSKSADSSERHIRRRRPRSAEARAKASARMKAAWVTRKAAKGQVAVQ